ncbi:hypothetical protein [Enterococcus olivae]
MKIIEELSNRRKEKQEQRKKELRRKNHLLRKKGIDPHQGWHRVVDTGVGGLNQVIVRSGSGTVDPTGNPDGTENFFVEEQKRLRKD